MEEILIKVGQWLMLGDLCLSDEELSVGIQELTKARDILNNLKEYHLAIRSLNLDINSLRSLQTFRENYNSPHRGLNV